jgi:NAD(P)-dependent dehydrogenase (short-subunit alcohol dehydrogenase family)
MKLSEATAIVTGASSGIGYTFTEDLVRRGARVFGLARRIDRMQEHREKLGERFVPVECDVREEESVEQAFKTIFDQTEDIDILINNAGLGRFGKVEELSAEDWDVQSETNLRGIFLCTRKVVPAMKRKNASSGFGGHIVNIASVAGLIGNAQLAAYNATKFGVRGMSESLMKELREDGIKVSCVYPGSIQTEFFDVAGSSSSPGAMHPADVSATVMHLIETPPNYLISEVVLRPLRPRG